MTLHERKVEDLRALQKYDRVDEKPFEAVAALSELPERAYSLLVRPFVREMTPEWLAKALRELHPLRVQYWALSDKNPLLWALPYAGGRGAARNRKPRAADNDRLDASRSSVSESSARRSTCIATCATPRREAAFFEVYGNMLSLQMADEREEIRAQDASSIRARCRPCAQVLDTIDEGSAVEGARAHRDADRQGRRRQAQARRRWQRTREMLVAERRCCAHMSEDERRRLLQEETIVVEFEPRARQALAAQAAAHAPAIASKRTRCSTRSSDDRGPRRRAARAGRPSCAGCCRRPRRRRRGRESPQARLPRRRARRLRRAARNAG